MNFDLPRPCADCPFLRVGAIDLREGRIESIVRGLLADDHQWFICHKTLHKDHSQCVGSMVLLLRLDAPNVSMRMAAAYGMLDYARLRALDALVIDMETSQ